MAFDFGRSYFIDRQLVKLDGEFTVNEIKVAISMTLVLHCRQAFSLLSLRKKIAKALKVDVGVITLTDMRLALDLLERQGSIEKTKTGKYKTSAVLMNRFCDFIKTVLIK